MFDKNKAASGRTLIFINFLCALGNHTAETKQATNHKSQHMPNVQACQAYCDRSKFLSLYLFSKYQYSILLRLPFSYIQ